MLIRLDIENFYSIKHRQELDFRIPQTSPVDSRFLLAPFDSMVRVPKVVTFFGANASGKTTLLRAIAFVLEFIKNSFSTPPSSNIVSDSFATEECHQSPTSISIEFIAKGRNNAPFIWYKYDLSLGNQGFKNYVRRERVRSSFDGKSFITLFDRTGNSERSSVKSHPNFQLARGDPRATVRPNVSLISTLVQFAHPPGEAIYHAFYDTFTSNVHVGKYSLSEEYVTNYLESNIRDLDHLNRIIRSIDVGIESVELREMNGSKFPVFRHSGLDRIQTLPYESSGTKSFYCLFPYLAWSLRAGGVAAMDELDSDLHPALVAEVIRWYQSAEENPYGAQLLMTTHTAPLLHELQKEELWLVEKDDLGETTVTSLMDFTGVRRDTNLYSKYMGGSFGALPRFG